MPLTTLLVLALTLQTVSSTGSDFLEPEEGTFGGYDAPSPYEILLHKALLADDRYRMCQLVSLPSFGREAAVYITQEKDQPFVVVTRKLKDQLWSQLVMELQKASPDKHGFSFDQASETAALRKISPSVDTHTATLDADAAAAVTDVCREVLLAVRYPVKPTNGMDGITYHAGHWTRGAFLSGKKWSPKQGTVIADFVAMEMALQSFANATSETRAAIRLELLEKARRLRARLNARPEGPASPGPS